MCCIKVSPLLKRTLRTFEGNPLDYYGFIKSFNATIREQVTEPASQLEYLIDMCTGKAREAIKHLSIVTPSSPGMNQAMETLHNRFGQKHIVVKAHLDSITDGPPVKLDKNSLNKFVTDLDELMPSNKECYLCLSCCDTGRLNDKMQQLFEQDFCEKSANIEFPLSVEDKLFLDKVGGSVTKLNGHYQIALPWRQECVTLPNNRVVAERRLVY